MSNSWQKKNMSQNPYAATPAHLTVPKKNDLQSPGEPRDARSRQTQIRAGKKRVCRSCNQSPPPLWCMQGLVLTSPAALRVLPPAEFGETWLDRRNWLFGPRLACCSSEHQVRWVRRAVRTPRKLRQPTLAEFRLRKNTMDAVLLCSSSARPPRNAKTQLISLMSHESTSANSRREGVDLGVVRVPSILLCINPLVPGKPKLRANGAGFCQWIQPRACIQSATSTVVPFFGSKSSSFSRHLTLCDYKAFDIAIIPQLFNILLSQ